MPYLAKVLYASQRSIGISSIREYNEAIDELVAENDIAVTPPDFFSYFQQHQDEIPDGLHPNIIGYKSMANLWFIALTR
jgi:lysophospholipase L1-like esterase